MNALPGSTWRLLHTPPAAGAWNMAVDEAILEAVGRGEAPPTLRLYAWQPPCLSLGYAQPIEDVDQLALARLGWDLVRRPTGGRAILHTDELTYAVIGPSSEPRLMGSVLESYRRIAQALLAALQRMGVAAQAAEQPPSAPESPSPTALSHEVSGLRRQSRRLPETPSPDSVFRAGAEQPPIAPESPSPTALSHEVNGLRRPSRRLLESPSPDGVFRTPATPSKGPVCFEMPSNYEITANGKKLVGSAQARRKEGVLQHGSLPLGGDLTRILQALAFPDEASRQAAAMRLRQRAATAGEILGSPPAWDEAAAAFAAGFAETLNVELARGELGERERQRAAELVEQKHGNLGWVLKRGI